jgi:hypothetical protein
MDQPKSTLRVGFAAADLTPTEPVLLAGQFHARVSEGVADPLSATAMAFESVREEGGRGVMVSCDLVSIADNLRDAIHAHLREDLPELDPALVFLNSTHTHTGPETRLGDRPVHGAVQSDLGIKLEVMPPEEYTALIARRIADAVIQAWRGRRPAAIGFGLGHATVGYNRRIVYRNGQTRMYGETNDPEFCHIEGSADTALNVIGVWDEKDKLLGVVVNLACPSQSNEQDWRVGADYWHETRQELRRRLGEDLFIVPQNSASGDITPAKARIMIDWRAQERMWRLMGLTQRQDIANRIADAVTSVLPHAHKDLQRDPVVRHRTETIKLSRRMLSEEDVRSALAEAQNFQREYQTLKADFEAHPEKMKEPRWYTRLTATYRRMVWNQGVAERFEQQKKEPWMPVIVHVLRLGDLAIATNPFEYYLDYSHQIRARSKAVQTLLIQHVGSGSYLPTQRAAAGGSYGAVPASTPVGPEGGRELAEWTIEAINAMWAQ